MTLEQALERMAQKGYWIEGPMPDGVKWWVRVTEGQAPSWHGVVATGDTWQEAYAEAMQEAPF